MFFKFVFFLFFVMVASDYHLTNFEGEGIPFILPKTLQAVPSLMPRPRSGQPLRVNVSVHLVNMFVNTNKEEFEVTLYLRQSWEDERLAFESSDPWRFREIDDPKSVWTTDLFVVNQIVPDPRAVPKPKGYIRVYPDGVVFTSHRINVTAACPMYLRLYPFDMQSCELQIESYDHPANEMTIEWNVSSEYPVTGDLITSQFQARVDWASACTKFRGVEYSSLKVQFYLKRTPMIIIFRFILPVSTITVISWSSFFFSKNEIIIRLTLCISPIMTYLMQLSFGRTFFIAPGYLTALDIWACLSFIAMLGALCECIYVIYRNGREENGEGDEGERVDHRAKLIFALCVIFFDIFCAFYVYLFRDDF